MDILTFNPDTHLEINKQYYTTYDGEDCYIHYIVDPKTNNQYYCDPMNTDGDLYPLIPTCEEPPLQGPFIPGACRVYRQPDDEAQYYIDVMKYGWDSAPL